MVVLLGRGETHQGVEPLLAPPVEAGLVVVTCRAREGVLPFLDAQGFLADLFPGFLPGEPELSGPTASEVGIEERGRPDQEQLFLGLPDAVGAGMAFRQTVTSGVQCRLRLPKEAVDVPRIAPSRAEHPEDENSAICLQVMPGVEPIGQRGQFFHV
ncbi:hypothetical protein AB6O49_32635 [Streptomyces sp. SBR177]